MRKIAQKGAMASKVKKAVAKGGIKTKKAQDGARNFDFSETDPYKNRGGLPGLTKSLAYNMQPFVKAKRASEAELSRLTPEQREAKEITARRVAAGQAGPQYMKGKPANQKSGGKTKAKAGAKAKKVVVKAKAKYGVAKKASSKRSK